MPASHFGKFLKLTVQGESHAPSLRWTLTNFPPSFPIDTAQLQAFMERRAPGRDALSTARRETDKVNLSWDGTTLKGVILNQDMRPTDYGVARTIPRPGHADFGQWVATGSIPTGGGANSGRLTAALCAAGGVCLQYLAARGIQVAARIEAIHGNTTDPESEILKAKAEGDSVGGTIICAVTGLPAGLGGALFDGLETPLAGALFAIPGVKGVEFGNGFEAALLKGSENNDAFEVQNGKVTTSTNRHGGLLGGRTTGMPLTCRVALKPTPTIFKPQPSVDLATLSPAICEMKGRHDPCIVKRAVPVVEAVMALALTEVLLADEATRPRTCLTLTGTTLEEDMKQYESQRYFTDLVELRVDLLQEAERARAVEFPKRVPVPVILTYRRKVDGGAFEGAEADRIAFFRRALAQKGFAYVDFEEDFRVEELANLAQQAGTQIIRSRHRFTGAMPDLVAVCRQLRGETNEIPKVAFQPQSEADIDAFFAQTKDFTDIPHILCAMGSLGLPTRVCAARSHSLLTYTSVGGLQKLGHLSPHDLRCVRKFAVLGHPIAHSLSPQMHRANFASLGFLGTYERMDVAPEALATTLKALQAEGFTGVNLTIPHKVAVVPLLDRLDDSVQKYGSCNTVRFERDGTMTGFNTDVIGFTEALAAHGFSLAGKRICILGRGGAGSALAACARAEGATEVQMFGRDGTLSEKVAAAQQADLVVNATPVGLRPEDPSVLPPEAFHAGQVVLDIIPTQAFPPTAAVAQAAGATAIGGLEFLVAQGAKAFELWTGIPADRTAMHCALRT